MSSLFSPRTPPWPYDLLIDLLNPPRGGLNLKNLRNPRVPSSLVFPLATSEASCEKEAYPAFDRSSSLNLRPSDTSALVLRSFSTVAGSTLHQARCSFERLSIPR